MDIKRNEFMCDAGAVKIESNPDMQVATFTVSQFEVSEVLNEVGITELYLDYEQLEEIQHLIEEILSHNKRSKNKE